MPTTPRCPAGEMRRRSCRTTTGTLQQRSLTLGKEADAEARRAISVPGGSAKQVMPKCGEIVPRHWNARLTVYVLPCLGWPGMPPNWWKPRERNTS